ncbi:MAG TPA: ATP-binding protein [Planctomycetota bacterium]|nr:ATP-binding protein [Planctomycetota bacterium]
MKGHRPGDIEGGYPTVLDVLKEVFRELEGDEGMAVSIVKANELRSDGKSLLLYGDSGIGKTHTCGTLPVGKTLIIDMDAGSETLSGSEHHIVRPETFGDFKEVYEGLRDGTLKYRFVVLDSLTELEKSLQMVRKHAKGKEFISMKEYGETSELMREYVRKFRDLRSQGISVVFTALEMPMDIQVNESETQTKAVPMLSKKFALEACGLVDMVARMIINPNSGERELHFAGGREFVAKTRVHCVRPVESPDLTDLYRRIFGIKPAADMPQEEKQPPAGEPAKPTKPGKKASENGNARDKEGD